MRQISVKSKTYFFFNDNDIYFRTKCLLYSIHMAHKSIKPYLRHIRFGIISSHPWYFPHHFLKSFVNKKDRKSKIFPPLTLAILKKDV